MEVDGTEGCLRAFTQLRCQYSELRVILSIGGGGAGSENFAAVASNQIAVEKFIYTVQNLATQFNLDGFDSEQSTP